MSNIAFKRPLAEAGRAAFILDDLIAHLVRRVHQRASAVYSALLGDHQLTPTQFFAMARLHEVGQMSQNKLGRMAAMDPATIQGVIQRLADRGFIERLPDMKDRRRMVLKLTESGRTLVESLMSGARAADEAVVQALSASERKAFAEMLHKLI